MKVLTERFRPSTFADVIGQPLAVKTLKSIAMSDGLPVRSIVLQGSYGSGKTTLSRILGKAMNCTKFKQLGDVCNECEACKEASRPNSQSYLEFDSTRVGNVESIKSLVENLYISPASGRRVVAVDEAHAVSKTALNSMLKVIEEGIPNTLFVFATTEELLKTIRSRSTFIEINTIHSTAIVEYIQKIAKEEGIEISESQLHKLARKSNGHMRDAVSLLDHFRLAGEQALETSYSVVSEYFLTCLKRQPVESVINRLVSNPIIDVNLSLAEFLINTFKGNGELEAKIKDKRLHQTFFKFFYQPEIQQALKDEDGLQLALYSFSEQFK